MNPHMKISRPPTDDREKLRQDRDKAMVEQTMGTYSGRRMVRSVLKLLRHNEKNLNNSAEAYRVAAKQEVAIDIQNMIYTRCPDLWEKMIREGVDEEGM